MREGDALFEIIKPGATTGCLIRVAAAVIEIVTALEGAHGATRWQALPL